MGIFEILNYIKMLKDEKNLDIKFLKPEEALDSPNITVVIKGGIPKGIYIPFSSISVLIELFEKIKKKSETS